MKQKHRGEFSALSRSAALATMVAAVVTAAVPADGKGLHLFGRHRQQTPVAAVPKPLPPPYRWTLGAAPKAHADLVSQFGRVGLKPGEYVWAATAPTQGEPRVVVDLLTQMAYVYRGEKLLGASTMSSAKTGHVTPYGNWTILEKRPFYRSKKYDNAPMPWMERIDDYGIAFHGGVNPGYPASHGCMRLPMKFAEKLYGVTKVGTKVVIEG